MKILKYIIFSLILTLSLSGGEVIETLPTRERAEMNIEVTKVFSEKLDALLDESNKEITLNFKEVPVDESQFEIFLIENLNSLPSYSVSKGGRKALEVIKNGARLRAGSKITTGKLSYFLDRSRGERALKIQYEEKPEKLYLGVLNKSTNTIAKVFNINYDTPITYAGAITHFYNGLANETEMKFEDNGNFVDSTKFYPITHSSSIDIAMDNHSGTSFRLSAIIGGHSLNLNGGNTIENGSVTRFIQPKVKVDNLEGELPIKLNLLSDLPSSNIQIFNHKMHPNDSSSIIALRGTTLSLKVKFQPSIDLDIIKKARTVNKKEVPLVWSTTTGQINQIALPKADWNNSGSIPHSNNNRTEVAPYPPLKIVKNQTTHSGTIEFSSRTESIIKNISDSNFFKGLKYKGYVGIFNTSTDTNALVYSAVSGEGVSDGGDSSELQFAKTNTSGNSITFKIKYNKGEPIYELVKYSQKDYTIDSETDRTFNFVIKYFEESGLVRKTDSVTVITPIMKHSFTSNISGEVILYDDGDSIKDTLSLDAEKNYVFAGGSMSYVIENIPNSYPSYFPVISLYNQDFSTPFAVNNLGENTKSISSDGQYKINFNGEKEIGINLYFGQDNYANVKNTYNSNNMYPFEITQKINGNLKVLRAYMLGGYIKNEVMNSVTIAKAGPDSYPALLRFRIPKNIFIENRNTKNSKETELPYITNNNIKFILGKKDETTVFVYPTKNTKETLSLPSIKIEKNQIIRDMTITIDRNYDEGFIDFNASGSTSKSGISLSSGFNMKGLPFKSNIIIKNKGIIGEITQTVSGEDIDGGGNTTQNINFEAIGENGKKAKIELKYGINGVPSLAVRDWTGPDTFKVQILHNEYSGLNRRIYNLDIVIPEINKLVVNHDIKQDITYLDEDRKGMTSDVGIPTYAVFAGGKLTATLENFGVRRFPVVTLGKSSVTEVYNYHQYNNFNDLILEYEEYRFKTRIHFWSYFNNSFNLEYLKKQVAVGKYANDTNENNISFTTDLRLNIPELNIIEMRKDTKFSNYEIILTPENKDFNVITAAIGKKNEQTTSFTVNSDSEPKITIPYPSIKFTKDNLTQSGVVSLNTSYQKNTTIDFNKDGAATSNTVTLETTSRFPQGLSYGGTMEISQDEPKIRETMVVNGLDKYTGAGDTSKHQFTLKDYLGRDAKISLQYRTDGLVSFSLDEWEGEGEINFTIVHKEGSGLTRKTTNMKIVTPKIGEEKSKGILDFGVLLKGSNVDYPAETSIVVQPFSGHNLILELDDSNKEKVSLTNGNSTVEATGLSIDSGVDEGTNKVFKLSGVITKDSLNKSTSEGTHTGTVVLQMKVKPATTVNLNNK